jgi:hypothetical protein
MAIGEERRLEVKIRLLVENERAFLQAKKRIAQEEVALAQVGKGTNKQKIAAEKKRIQLAKLNLQLQSAQLALQRLSTKEEERRLRVSRGFKMELLSIMFGFMLISRTLTTFLKSAIETFNQATNSQGEFTKQTMRLNAAWTFLKFRLIDALGNSDLFASVIDFLIKMVDAVASLDDETMEKIATSLVTIAALSTLAFIAASIGLLAAGIVQLVGKSKVLDLIALSLARLGIAGTGPFLLLIAAIIVIGIAFKAFMEGLLGREITWGEIFEAMGKTVMFFGDVVRTVFGIIADTIKFTIGLLVTAMTALGEGIRALKDFKPGEGTFREQSDFSGTKRSLEALKSDNFSGGPVGEFDFTTASRATGEVNDNLIDMSRRSADVLGPIGDLGAAVSGDENSLASMLDVMKGTMFDTNTEINNLATEMNTSTQEAGNLNTQLGDMQVINLDLTESTLEAAEAHTVNAEAIMSEAEAINALAAAIERLNAARDSKSKNRTRSSP